MKKKVLRLTETQFKDLITKTVKRVMTEQSMENERFSIPFTKDDLGDWEFTDSDTFVLSFYREGDDDIIDYTFDVNHRISYYSSGEEPTWDYPGSGEEIEISIDSVKLISPYEKKLNVKEFEDMLDEFGVSGYFWSKLEEFQRKKMEDDRDAYWEDRYDDMMSDRD